MNNNYLIHFGNKNSGRYPRGSGENPHQHDGLTRKDKKAIKIATELSKRQANVIKYENAMKETSKIDKNRDVFVNGHFARNYNKSLNQGIKYVHKIDKKYEVIKDTNVTRNGVEYVKTIIKDRKTGKEYSGEYKYDGKLSKKESTYLK